MMFHGIGADSSRSGKDTRRGARRWATILEFGEAISGPERANDRNLLLVRMLLIVLVIGVVEDTRPSVAADPVGVRVPDGFRVTLFADDELAHDIYSLTIDSLGRVTVSGAGYIRILIDSDGDGVADGVQQFADGPQSGAQGMYWFGRDLLCVGDSGLWRYRDRDGDDRADGPPDRFLEFKAGGEHDVHSVQKGPDGWWYLIAGNYAGITSRYATLPTSPIRNPHAGTLFRLKPNLTGGEIVAHGMRNSYDFAFNSNGDVFAFDSDGERDVSLPWYRPTRVFHLLTGSHAGWVTRSWKQPYDFVDMPPVMAEFGRGSPTGAVCYRHWRFPGEYHDSLFVLDWTYGRVLNIRLQREGASYQPTPEPFMTGVGNHGFAPTDCDVGPDGSLFVSVGGRGTRGGVYRVVPAAESSLRWPGNPATPTAKAFACLTAPMPLSSWSRSLWQPLAREAGAGEFVRAAIDTDLPAERRVRAIEILVEVFGGFGNDVAERLRNDQSPEVRARAVWGLGRTRSGDDSGRSVTSFLGDRDPFVGRVASESLLGQPGEISAEEAVVGLARRLASGSRFDRVAAARLIPQLSQRAYADVSARSVSLGPQAEIAAALGSLGRNPGFNANAFETGSRVFESNNVPVETRLEAVRLMQLALGDLTPEGKVAAVFDGYASAIDLSDVERLLDPYRIRLAEQFPTGDERLDEELARLLAVLQPFNAALLSRVLEKISDDSHPTRDVHYLIVAARIPALRDAAHREAVARGLVGIEGKLRTRKLHQDSNWDDRFRELYQSLVELDEALPIAIVEQPGFGEPGHVLYMSQFPPEALEPAIAAFSKRVAECGDEYPWTNDVIFVFGESKSPEHRDLVRSQFETFSVRNSVLVVLSGDPQPQDRSLFVQGLEVSQPEVLTACLDALGRLPASDDGAENVALVRCLRRLGAVKNESPLRDRVVQLLRRNSQREFGFAFLVDGALPVGTTEADQRAAIDRWTDWVVKEFPNDAVQLREGGGTDASTLRQTLALADWASGDAARGRAFFEKRSCAQCHGGRQALGPDLSGVAGRFSRDDLFTAIVDPNRDVSNRYQTTMIETTDGKVFSGLIIYESVDGLILRNSTNQTFRVATRDIEFRRQLPQSLMPTGLLKDATPENLADLYAYLRSLSE
jgi:putative membrane-bound dehydrogenase-like protein